MRLLALVLVFAAATLVGGTMRLAAQQPSGDLGPSGHHGQGHADNHDWYQKLKHPGTGVSCCNGTKDGIEGDCRRTRAYPGDDGIWRALVDGKWVSVPPQVVLKQLSPDGNSHVCAGFGGTIFCFLGGSPQT